jgi:hypothetical protein
MFPSVLLAALGGTLLIADGLPALNVESGCRAAAKMGDSLSLDTSLRQCLADEKSARDELEKQWTQFSPALRERCVATTETAGKRIERLKNRSTVGLQKRGYLSHDAHQCSG